MKAIEELVKGTRSLLQGMTVTFDNMRKPPVTVSYPREHAPISPVQRNAIRLIEKEETGGSHACIACNMCEKICPSDCITVVGEKVDGIATKRPQTFHVRFDQCSECGLCLDVCPKSTLGWSTEYTTVGYQREFVVDLLEPHRDGEEAAREVLREEEARKRAAREAKRKADEEAKARKAAADAAKEDGAATDREA